MSQIVAKAISRAFDLYSWSLIINTLFLFRTGLVPWQQLLFSIIFSIFEIFLPILLFLFFLKRKYISDYEITDRKERPLFFGSLVILVGMATIPVLLFGTTYLIYCQLGIFLAAFALFSCSLFWKISGHALINGIGASYLNLFFGWSFWPVYFVLVPVGWARLKLKKHSVSQLIFGGLLGAGIPYLIMLRL